MGKDGRGLNLTIITTQTRLGPNLQVKTLGVSFSALPCNFVFTFLSIRDRITFSSMNDLVHVAIENLNKAQMGFSLRKLRKLSAREKTRFFFPPEDTLALFI